MYFLEDNNAKHKISRRNFLKLGIFAAVSGIIPCPSIASVRYSFLTEKSISLYNIHTGESLRAVYWSHGEYLSEALNDINYIMRDFRANEIRPIDTHLLDFLNAIRIKLDTQQYFHIISGYRCPATNEFLWRNSKGVARNSLHMYGQAVDIRVPKHNISLVRRVAMHLRYGGVGYYPSSNFIHIDVGKVRYWKFNSLT